MAGFFFVLLWIITLSLVPVGLGLLLFYVPKFLGYPKAGKYATLIYSILLSTVLCLVVFEDELFTKNDALELIEEQGISLKNPFELIENKSQWAMADSYHTFTLQISTEDTRNAIEKIKSSGNFKKDGDPIEDLIFSTKDRHSGPIRIQSYESGDEIITEYHKPNGQGYAPTFRRISILKTSQLLIFEDIVE